MNYDEVHEIAYITMRGWEPIHHDSNRSFTPTEILSWAHPESNATWEPTHDSNRTLATVSWAHPESNATADTCRDAYLLQKKRDGDTTPCPPNDEIELIEMLTDLCDHVGDGSGVPELLMQHISQIADHIGYRWEREGW